jgi:hypothetical protein
MEAPGPGELESMYKPTELEAVLVYIGGIVSDGMRSRS